LFSENMRRGTTGTGRGEGRHGSELAARGIRLCPVSAVFSSIWEPVSQCVLLLEDSSRACMNRLNVTRPDRSDWRNAIRR